MRRLLILVAAMIAVSATASEITRDSVVAAMNERRLAAGLPPLREDPRLESAAGDRMRDMEERGYWSHFSPDGEAPFRWVRSRGYDFRYAAENLAAGFETTELMAESWMESDGHRANILSPLYQDCGVAVIDGLTTRRGTGRSVVVLFGRAVIPSVSEESGRRAAAAH